MRPILTLLLLALLHSAVAGASDDEALRRRALELEEHRIEVIARVAPACVCISQEVDGGGGSGVLIDERGYGLTNFHVIAAMSGTRTGYGGLSDGVQYKLEVLGMDITGDVAMFRLIGRDRYPFAELGDSDSVEIGDSVIAMGNPFSLALDFKPTVTTGIVSGVHRYQGEGDTLVYTDCIQTDASINPGNSGGPLFDSEGRVIGINGRISAEMHKYARGRFNVGLGYAISINQIRRFIPHLRAGLLGKHGTLLATVADDGDQVVFDDMYEDAPAWDAGIRVGDRLLRFGDEDIRSANHFTSLIGTYPEHWPVPVTFESRRGVTHKVIRLESVTPSMKRPYRVPERVNRLAIKEAIDAFREAVGAGERGERWSWRATRTSAKGVRTEYSVRDVSENMTERIELTGAGEVARTLVVSSDCVKIREGDSTYDVGTEASLFYTAVRTLRGDFLWDGDFWDARGAKHLGGDALVEIDENGRVIRTRLLETVVWDVSEHVSMRVGFELDSHLPARIVVRDAPTDVTVEIELDEYRTDGGIRWPHLRRVRGPRLRFEEVVSGLRVE